MLEGREREGGEKEREKGEDEGGGRRGGGEGRRKEGEGRERLRSWLAEVGVFGTICGRS